MGSACPHNTTEERVATATDAMRHTLLQFYKYDDGHTLMGTPICPDGIFTMK
jgi:hypothetical protein